MSLLSRYLMKAVISYTLMVMVVLLMLSGLYIFITQLNEIGVGRYRVLNAFVYVLLNLPQYGFELFPIGALIGALLGLGNLARGSELVVMRASGVSVAKLSAWVATAGLAMAIVTWLLGDFVAPPLEHYAEQQKAFAKMNEATSAGTSIWSRDGNTFISVQQQSQTGTGLGNLGGLSIFQFDEQRNLQFIGHADTAKVTAGRHWTLQNYVESRFKDDSVIPSKRRSTELETRLSPDFLSLAAVTPDAMSGLVLYRYIQHLRANDLDTTAYETEFWARIARTTALIVVVVLAVPFALGPLRSSGGGARTVVGILIGAAFFLLARVLQQGGTVFHLSPPAVAWVPTLLLALFAGVAVWRVR